MVTLVFLTPLLKFFGSPDNVLEYAKVYTGIIAFGFPFLILSAGGRNLLCADGSPNLTMVCNIVGAVVNTILDAIFDFFCFVPIRTKTDFILTTITNCISNVYWY